MTEDNRHEQGVIQAEDERCRAANAGEWDALAELLTDEMTFVHSIGQIDTKTEWLAEIQRIRRYSFRDSLSVRVLGEVALTTGGMVHVFVDDAGVPRRVLPVTVMQVWVYRDDAWKLLVQQNTRVAVGS